MAPEAEHAEKRAPVGHDRGMNDDHTVVIVTVDVPCVTCQSYMLKTMQATDPTVVGLVIEHEGFEDGFVAYITYAGLTLARPQRVHRCILPAEDAAGVYRQIHENGPKVGFRFQLATE